MDKTALAHDDLKLTENVAKMLACTSMFWRPNYLYRSAWVEHVPFAFWITEAHRPRTIVELGTHFGMSYFAFCQAVDRLGLDTRCFAIDTWKGDEHAGFYGEAVFKQVSAHNSSNYSSFSRLVRSTFKEALPHFIDGSIDLLHIDGHHSLESVKQDLEDWLPKLSDRAIVLFHDTNVRERGFGVFRLIESLRSRYQVFDFVHGNGLGVVAIGSGHSDEVRALLEADRSEIDRRLTMQIFGRLGRACADTLENASLRSLQAEHEKRLDEQREAIAELSTSRDEERAELETFRQQSQEVVAQVERVKEALAAEQRMAAVLQQDKELLRAELLESQRHVSSLLHELTGHRQIVAELEEKIGMEQASFKEALDAAERAQQALDQDITDRFAEIATLSSELFTRTDDLDKQAKAADALCITLKDKTDAYEELCSASSAIERQLRRRVFRLLCVQHKPASGMARSRRAKPPTDDIVRTAMHDSGLFNSTWYLERYADVKEHGVDPYDHYLKHGAGEGRDPCSVFSTLKYCQLKGENEAPSYNPLIYYALEEADDYVY
ncbi:class I SAM-dependent methyltransferase [Ensifer canadensis]